MVKGLQAVLFDVDGTLAETEDAHRLAFNAAFEAAGLNWHWDQALYKELLQVTGGKERIRFHQEREGHVERLDDDAIKALHADKTERYTGMIRSGAVGLRPGIRDLMDQCRVMGVKMAIATTTSLPNIVALIEATLGPGKMDWFDAVGAGDQVNAKKPAPDVYLKVLGDLDLPADACVALEDSANGLRSALAAGVPTVITTSVYTLDQDFTGALAVTQNLRAGGVDLPELARLLAGKRGQPSALTTPAERSFKIASLSASRLGAGLRSDGSE